VGPEAEKLSKQFSNGGLPSLLFGQPPGLMDENISLEPQKL
jgi:hypothetical protein